MFRRCDDRERRPGFKAHAVSSHTAWAVAAAAIAWNILGDDGAARSSSHPGQGAGDIVHVVVGRMGSVIETGVAFVKSAVAFAYAVAEAVIALGEALLKLASLFG